MPRPVRPSTQRASAAKVNRDEPVRLVFTVHPRTRYAIKVRAAQEGKTIKSYLMGLAKADGVPCVPEDLRDGRRDEEST
jgi:hypothetical protein